MDTSVISLFADVIRAGVPYALTWIVGTWIVRTLIGMVTGRSYEI